MSPINSKKPHPAPEAEALIEKARLDFNVLRDDWRTQYTEGEAFHQAVGKMIAAGEPTDVLLLRIELERMIKAATMMAQHILAQPAEGVEALSGVRRVANDVMAARGPEAGQ